MNTTSRSCCATVVATRAIVVVAAIGATVVVTGVAIGAVIGATVVVTGVAIVAVIGPAVIVTFTRFGMSFASIIIADRMACRGSGGAGYFQTIELGREMSPQNDIH